MATVVNPSELQAHIRRDAQALQAAVPAMVRVSQFRGWDRICCHDISVTQCHALEALVEHGPLLLSALVCLVGLNIANEE